VVWDPKAGKTIRGHAEIGHRLQRVRGHPDLFWSIVDQAVAESLKGSAPDTREDAIIDARIAAIRNALMQLSKEELIAFDADLVRFSFQAYRWDLWGVAVSVGRGMQ
jgi:hypothetical protein